MAEDNVDDILVRLDEIEKLQAELRHLVPRVTSSSSRHAVIGSHRDDPPRDSPPPASTRFPSLFMFPAISTFTSTPRNEERVQRSAGRLNFKSLSGNRRSTVNLKSAEGSSRGSGTRETSVLKNLLRSSNNVTGSHARNSSASTSAADSKAPTRSGVAISRRAEPQKAIRKRLKSENSSKIAARDRTQRATAGERSNVQLPGTENYTRSSVQTSDIRVHGTEATQSRGTCLRNRHCDRSTLERIMGKLNYCFVDDKRVTVPYHHPGNKTPRRV